MCETPYLPSEWDKIPCVQRDVALESNVGFEGAVFAQRPAPDRVYPLDLPRPALWTDENGTRLAGVIVQAEPQADAPDVVVLGIAMPDGTDSITLLSEVELFAEPSDEWMVAALATYQRKFGAAQ